MNIDEKLKSIIKGIANVEIVEGTINDETILTMDLKFDSIQIIELIVELETQFEIKLDEEDLDLEKLSVYKNLFKLVEDKLND